METKGFGAIIEMAIAKEEEACNFYIGLSDEAKTGEVRDTLRYIAAEEKQHKEFLVNYRDKGYSHGGLSLDTIVDYRIAEQLEAPEPGEDMGVKDVYLIAAHREKKANDFYLSLAAIHPDGDARRFLLKMAEEELRHKEKMEFLYTNAAFPPTGGV